MFVTIYRQDEEEEYIVDIIYITTTAENFMRCKENKKLFKELIEKHPNSTFRAEKHIYTPIYAFDGYEMQSRTETNYRTTYKIPKNRF